MVSFLSILASLLGLTCVVVITWAVYVSVKQKEVVKETAPEIINLASDYSNFRYRGIQTKKVKGAGGRVKITYKPQDLNLKDLSSKKIKEKLKEVDIITDSNKVIDIPAGLISEDKNIKIIIPHNAREVPEYLRNNDLGRAIMWLVEEKNAEKTIIDMLEEGKLRRSDILLKIGDGELTRDWMQTMEQRAKDSLKSLVTEKKEKPQVFGAGGMHDKGT